LEYGMSIDGPSLVLAALGLFLAGVLKGGTGLGFSSCALPFLVPTVGLPAAMILIVGPALATNISVAIGTPHAREIVGRFWVLYLSIVPGIAAGTLLLVHCDRNTAVKALGLSISSYAILAVLRPGLRLHPSLARRLQVPVGIVHGLVAGFIGSQIMPLLPYMMAQQLEPARLVQAVNMAVLLGSTAVAVGLISSGLVGAESALWSIPAVGPAVAGAWLGLRCRTVLSVAYFRHVVLAVLFVIGAAMLTQ
jgi:uncharacterized protein